MDDVVAVDTDGFDEDWERRRTGRGRDVWALRNDRQAPWRWQVRIAGADDPAYGSEILEYLRDAMAEALRRVPGVTVVDNEDEATWVIQGSPLGPDLVRAGAAVIDGAVDEQGEARPEAVKGMPAKVAHLLKKRVADLGFSGTGRCRYRELPTGDLETFVPYAHYDHLFIELGWTPGRLRALWAETNHWRLAEGPNAPGFQAHLSDLLSTPGSATPITSYDPVAAAGSILADVAGAGRDWYDRFTTGDPWHVNNLESNLVDFELTPFAAWMIDHPDHPDRSTVISQLWKRLDLIEVGDHPADRLLDQRLLELLGA